MIDDLIRNINRLNIESIVREAALSEKNYAEDLQRGQMNDGLLATGQPITPEYTKAYKARKRKLGQPSNKVTLKLSGEFQSEIFLIIDGMEYYFDSKDEVKKYLLNRYGQDIFGLDDKNNDLYIERIDDKIVQTVANSLLRL